MSRSAKFQVFPDSSGEWRWHLVAGNGEVVAQSEGYDSQGNAERGVDAARRTAGEAVLTEVLDSAPTADAGPGDGEPSDSSAA